MTALLMKADTIGFKLSAWFKRLQAEQKRAHVARKTIDELSKLTDKELNDIGISRGDIYSIAWEIRND